MKLNHPITQTEIQFSESETLVSKTDLKGIITYANQAFIKTSGYSESELIGQAHNLVRHPDMPPEAFSDLWANCKAGKPWTGIVKNRCKNGDFYWVIANVAPIFEGQRPVGFMSVRGKPTRQQIEAADNAYRLFRDGKANGLKISQGNVIKNNLLARISAMFQKMQIGTRLNGLIGLALLASVILGALGVIGLGQSQTSLKSVYEDRMLPVRDLASINEWMIENKALLRTVLSEVKITSTVDITPQLAMNGDDAKKTAAAISANIASISDLWKSYMATTLTPEEQRLAEQFGISHGKFVNDGLKPAIVALQANDYLATREIANTAKALYTQADLDLETLKNLQFDIANGTYQAGVKRYENSRLIALGVLGGSCVLLLWLGLLITRSITRPLNQAIGVFSNISNGQYATPITVSGEDEVSKVLLGLKTMQTKLGFDIEETKRVLDENTRIRNALDNASTGMMICDNERNIIYTNKTVINTLTAAEADVKKDLQHFSAAKIMGASIDIFHKNPAHQKQLLSTLTATHKTQLTLGGRTFALAANPVFDTAGNRLGAALEWDDITAFLAAQAQERQLANENLRIKIALDNVSTNVMIADNDLNIIYVNESVTAMMTEAEADLRKVLPTFKAATLVGTNIDQFHKNPAHQRALLATLNSTVNTQITVSNHIFGLSANPVINAQGERLGSVVEWKDNTLEVAIETEVAAMVRAASNGDLTQRINIIGKKGFFLNFSESINTMVDVTESIINQTAAGLSRIAEGDLRQPIEGDFEGSYRLIKDSCNETMARLTDIITEV
ncbi:MAG: MCP four helix bundle domain-containing protein, partial [Methylococcaceae bacterium]